MLFCKPDRKGNSSLLHVVAASHDPRSGRMFGAGQRSDEDDDDEDEDAEPIVAMTCISLHTSGHGARSALASLQLRSVACCFVMSQLFFSFFFFLLYARLRVVSFFCTDRSSDVTPVVALPTVQRSKKCRGSTFSRGSG